PVGEQHWSNRTPPRKQLNLNAETQRMLEELLDHLQTYCVQKDAKASELFQALVGALHEAKGLLDYSELQPRGRWGSPTARAFTIGLKNIFARAIARRQEKAGLRQALLR